MQRNFNTHLWSSLHPHSRPTNRLIPTYLRIPIVVLIFFATLFNCSPAPMLQSPHVKSAVSIGTNAIYDKQIQDVNLTIDEIYSVNPFWLKFNISNRVELSGMILPTSFRFGLLSGNLKVFIFEHGSPLLFRNISSALFAGGNGNWDEWTSTNSVYIGTIFATRHTSEQNEIEFIIQPSYYHWNTTNTGGEGGSYECKASDGVHVNFGIIYTPNPNPENRLSIELVLGGAYRYVIDSDWRTYEKNSLTSINKSDFYTHWIGQFGLSFNWKRKDR